MSAPDHPITTALRDLADQAAPPRILVDAAWRAGRRRRWAAIGIPAVAMAAALAAVAAASPVLTGTFLTARGGERVARPTRPAASVAVPGSASWARLPRAPIAPRSEYAAVWTGKEMIVWGGYSNTTHGDGAAYDPAIRTWTKIAAGPLTAQDLPVAVWTGKDMLIFGGSGVPGPSPTAPPMTLRPTPGAS